MGKISMDYTDEDLKKKKQFHEKFNKKKKLLTVICGFLMIRTGISGFTMFILQNFMINSTWGRISKVTIVVIL